VRGDAVLRAKISLKFAGLVGRLFPQEIASSLVKALRLKIPTTPIALAATLLAMTDSIIKGLEKTKSDLESNGIVAKGSIGRTDEVTGEILWALYCLAVAILGEDEFAAEKSIFRLYTARAFEELEGLLSESPSKSLTGNSADEAINLYMRERPSLTEMAQQMSEYVSSVEVQKVEEMKNWSASLSLKAKTRILFRLGVTIDNVAAELIGMSFQIPLLNAIELFRKMRPVFVEP
jgi:hypothetical protein